MLGSSAWWFLCFFLCCCCALGQEKTEGDEWTVVLRRGQFGNTERYFSDKLWEDYKTGFGNSSDGEFWLGLDKMSEMTREESWELRVEMTDWGSENETGTETYWAIYDSFQVGPGPRYRLQVSGFLSNSSTLGDCLTTDGLSYANGAAFSTRDRDNDNKNSQAGNSWTSCARRYSGAWWYNACMLANLNGVNYPEKKTGWDGIVWYYGGQRGNNSDSWRQAEMKIRQRRDVITVMAIDQPVCSSQQDWPQTCFIIGAVLGLINLILLVALIWLICKRAKEKAKTKDVIDMEKIKRQGDIYYTPIRERKQMDQPFKRVA